MKNSAGSETRRCQVCGTTRVSDLRRGTMVRPVVTDLVREDTGQWDEAGWICVDDIQKYRHRYLERLLQQERGELTSLEHEVLESLRTQEILSENQAEEFEEHLSFGERLSDRIASFGGSWVFISIFGAVLFLWMILNSYMLATRAFDPYPYILLNLILSCLAAIQAPIIMMSQKRQEDRDRLRATHDYQVNLKAELEIRHLHQKIDHLMSHQWERLLEIQDVQMDLIDELKSVRRNRHGGP